MFVVFISFQFFLLSKYNNLNNAVMFFFACSNAVSILKSDIRLSFIFFFLFLFCFFFCSRRSWCVIPLQLQSEFDKIFVRRCISWASHSVTTTENLKNVFFVLVQEFYSYLLQKSIKIFGFAIFWAFYFHK